MSRRPLWLWPNLLSLDAPIVAVVWLWIFVKTWQVVWLPDVLPWLVGLVVWCVYVADRLLDQRGKGSDWHRLSSRHQFHSQHKLVFGGVLAVAVVAVLVLLAFLPTHLWWHGMPIAVLVALYFFLAWVGESEVSVLLKNILAGVAFAYGTTIGVYFYRPDVHVFRFILSPEVLVFALLCIVNITAIDIWESARDHESGYRPSDVVLTAVLFFLVLGTIVFAGRGDQHLEPFFWASMVAAGALQFVNLFGRSWSMDLQRVMADLAMVFPALPIFIERYSNLPS